MQNYKCVAEDIYPDRDNVIDWVLLDDEEPIVDLSAVTRVTITIGDDTIDSVTVGNTVIWWTDQEEILWNGELINTDVLKMKLGGQGLTPGIYNGCVLVVYEPAEPNGVLWVKDASITVYPSG